MISSRYAKALLSFAAERKLETDFYLKARQLVKSISTHPKLILALENPVVEIFKKKQLIMSGAGVRKDEYFERFVQLLLDNKRETYIQLIMLKYIDFYREKNNIYSGKLITATAIDSITEKRLISVIENQKKGTLEIRKEINETLLGGFILEVDNTRWDASVQSQLQKIKNELITKK